MARLAFRSALAAVAALALLAARPAAASTPQAIYVVPSQVELTPSDDAATRVVIHGAFFRLTSTTDTKYGEPMCGVMAFDCVPGQEAMCRMQWKELRAAISATTIFCQGFGSLSVISTATLHAEGEAIGTPDKWDLGMGISVGTSVDGKCQPATKLECGAAGDAGVAVPDGNSNAVEASAGTDATTSTGDAATSGDAPAASDTGTTPPPADAASTADASGSEDAAATVDAAGQVIDVLPDNSGCGCALSGASFVPGSLLALGLAALGLSRARRRRR